MARMNLLVLAICLTTMISVASANEIRYSGTPVYVPGASYTSYNDVSNNGHVVGSAYLGQLVTGFRSANGRVDYYGPQGGSYATLEAINRWGTAVGSISSPSGSQHAVLIEGNGIRDLNESLGGYWSTATALNDAGTIAGELYGPGTNWQNRLYVRKAGGETTLIPAGSNGGGWVAGMSEAGHVVGMAPNSVGEYRGFSWHNGQLREINGLGGDWMTIAGVNSAGQVVGYSLAEPNGSTTHAFLWEDGGYENLSLTLGAEFSEATGINDAGTIVGSAYSRSEGYYPFIIADGVASNLNDLLLPGLEVEFERIFAISGKGTLIAGTNSGLGYVLTPHIVPEPSSLALLILGALATLRRRR
jgi:probable HAF family extracellular repeat protein